MAQELKTGPLQEPVDRLKSEARGLASALGARAVSSVLGKVDDATDRLTGYVDEGGGPGLAAAVTGAKNLAEGKGPMRSLLGGGMTAAKQKIGGLLGRGGRGGQGKKQLKLTNIVESIDVGAPIGLAYNQWTQFSDFPTFMKKVESVEQAEDQKLNWKAQVLWSHRTWEATILEQVPDDKIVWRSKAAKGHVDGAVTFHELAPGMTRINLVMEYHPQGFFEHTGNLWRAQGRRARLELKHFRRHLMTQAVLHPEEIEGWRGTIHDGEVAQDHDGEVAQDHDEEVAQDDDAATAEEQRDGRRGKARQGAEGRGDRPNYRDEYAPGDDAAEDGHQRPRRTDRRARMRGGGDQ